MKRRFVAAGFLVLAGVANLPLVHGLVGSATAPPWLALSVGLLSMGLCWAGGVTIEGRRRRTAVALALLGVLEGALAFSDLLAQHTRADPRAWLLASGALSLAGLVAMLRR